MPAKHNPEGSDSSLLRLAQTHGIQTTYLDNLGRRQFASEETLRLLLDGLGVQEEGRGALPGLEPVTVAWQGARSTLSLRLPAKEISKALFRLQLEDGDEECIPLRELAPKNIPPKQRDNVAELQLDVPELPIGYHTIALESGSSRIESLLISAPKKLYSQRQRQWGAFLPLYAAHSSQSWGAGNFSDWRNFSQWIGSLGGSVVGTLPIMSAFLDRPICEPSPYSPASRLFWNEFFIDIESLPEFQASAAAQKLAGSASFQQKLSQFRASDYIDYKEQWTLRRSVLELLAREFFARPSDRYQSFRAYIQARPEVHEYAQFRAACDAKNQSWHSWDAAAKNGQLKRGDYSEEVKSFYLFIQWLAQEGMDNVLVSCRHAGVKFYLDLPLGVNPDGFDAWRHKDYFAPGMNVGAPPDSFFTKGQNWGFAPLHPRRMRELKYKYVIDYLRFQMAHTGLLRIDHVMGLHRLWWVPHGYPASAGAYVSYPAEELYAILSVESHRHKTTLVGENLGTVPPEVNKSMGRHGMRRMYVLQYEVQPKGPPSAPERDIVASVNTHDMPSFAAHWHGRDIEDRVDLGLIPKKDISREHRSRELLKKNLIAALRKGKFLKSTRPTTADVLDAVLRYLAKSPAETVLVTLEDLWNEERSQNVPGTSIERPNWRRKAKHTLEEIRADKKLSARLIEILKR